MKEPSEWTDFERALLDAAAHDEIPPQLKARMGQAFDAPLLGAGAAGSGSTGAGASLLFSKVVKVGVATALLAGGIAGWQVVAGPRGEKADRPEVVALPPSAAADPRPSPPQPTAAEPAVMARARATAVPVDPAALREEIALLDASRLALKRHAPERALAHLARYEARFPQGELAPEAAAMRIEALVHTGATERARRLAVEFLAAHPASPLAPRIERLVMGARR